MAEKGTQTESELKTRLSLPSPRSHISRLGLPAVIVLAVVFPLFAGDYWIDVAVFGDLCPLGLKLKYYRR